MKVVEPGVMAAYIGPIGGRVGPGGVGLERGVGVGAPGGDVGVDVDIGASVGVDMCSATCLGKTAKKYVIAITTTKITAGINA